MISTNKQSKLPESRINHWFSQEEAFLEWGDVIQPGKKVKKTAASLIYKEWEV